MHKIRQILLFLDRGFSQRSIEKETGVNRRTISNYLQRFIESGLSYSELLLMGDVELEAYLYPDTGPLRNETFTGLSGLNHAIRTKLAEHHHENFQRKTFSRLVLEPYKFFPFLRCGVSTPPQLQSTH